uniref:Nucelotide kinase n=1 Tax=virus sp. ctDJ83 TaxID=2827625 RepID=A0A8S5RJP1_9VIRU|nr:MAG TPA: nucelotide kinase [virus sp. ctDJ83]
MKATDTQIGGSHYKDMPYQPIKLIDKLELDYFSGNVLKYLCRYRQKGGAEDLKKARHYCELAKELNVIKFSPSTLDTEEVEDFVRINQISEEVEDIILYDLLRGLWDDAIDDINKLIEAHKIAQYHAPIPPIARPKYQFFVRKSEHSQDVYDVYQLAVYREGDAISGMFLGSYPSLKEAEDYAERMRDEYDKIGKNNNLDE